MATKKYKIGGGFGHKKPKNIKRGPTLKTKTKSRGLSSFYKQWDPMQPLRGKSAKREVNAATRLEFDPQRRELNRSMAGSDLRQQQLDKWYSEYQNHLQQLQGQTAQAYQQANQQIGQFSAQTAGYDQQNQQAIAQRAQQDAAIRGVQYTPQNEQTQANAANARQNLLASMQGTVAGQGANVAAYGNARVAAAHQQQGEAKASEADRKAQLLSDARELAAKEGDFRVDFLRQLREDERKFGIEKAAAKVDKFKARTDRQKAKETGRHNRAGEANTRRGQNLTRKSSKEGHNVTLQGQKSTNIRDRKNRRQDAKQHTQDLAEKRKSRKASNRQNKKGKL